MSETIIWISDYKHETFQPLSFSFSFWFLVTQERPFWKRKWNIDQEDVGNLIILRRKEGREIMVGGRPKKGGRGEHGDRNLHEWAKQTGVGGGAVLFSDSSRPCEKQRQGDRGGNASVNESVLRPTVCQRCAALAQRHLCQRLTSWGPLHSPTSNEHLFTEGLYTEHRPTVRRLFAVMSVCCCFSITTDHQFITCHMTGKNTVPVIIMI